ncbi:MAG: DUF423 domain-containing protein [Betaproteobacteria bacterium]
MTPQTSMAPSLRLFFGFACISGLLSVAVSATAAHGLHLAAQDLQALSWAVDLQRFHALALIGLTLMGLVRGSNWLRTLAGLLFMAGTVLFSVNIELRVLHGFDALRPGAPWGGSVWMLAWLLWAVGELRPETQTQPGAADLPVQGD